MTPWRNGARISGQHGGPSEDHILHANHSTDHLRHQNHARTQKQFRSVYVVIARLHIGHSFITRSFLLKDEEPPMCIGCDELLTIEHILLTCSDLVEIRESHFAAQSLRVLFQDIPPEKIFNFLKEINLFREKNN